MKRMTVRLRNVLGLVLTYWWVKDTEDSCLPVLLDRLVLGLVLDYWEVNRSWNLVAEPGFHSWCRIAGRQENAVLDMGPRSREFPTACVHLLVGKDPAI